MKRCLARLLLLVPFSILIILMAHNTRSQNLPAVGTGRPSASNTKNSPAKSALKKLPPAIAGQVKLVFVTTDPERDSPAVLRRWLDLFDRHFIGLTGTERAIEAVERAAGVPVAVKTGLASGNYAVSHANFVVAYSKDNLAHVIYPGGISKDDWVHDLPILIWERWMRRPD